MKNFSQDSGMSAKAEYSASWASGRKLTSEERVRKREVDRRTKAANRQKEKQRVIELETQIVELKQRDAAQNSYISELLQEIGKLKQENAKRRQDLVYVRSIESALVGTNVDRIEAAPDQGLLTDAAVTDAPIVPWPSSANSENLLDRSDSTIVLSDSIKPSTEIVKPIDQTTVDPSDLSIQSVDETTNNDIFKRMIESARKVQAIPLSAVSLNDVKNQDSLIKMVLSEDIGKPIDCLALQRMLDTTRHLLKHFGMIERFVMARLIHQMMLFQIARRSGHKLVLPDWYKPRPVQLRVRHEEIADYFAWPSFRERLVFSLAAISGDNFWTSFAQNFQFCGSTPTLDNIIHIDSNGTYSFVPAFENDMRNFKFWRMRLEFFEQFPDLYDFMVPLEPFPKQLPPTQLANLELIRSENEEKHRRRKQPNRVAKLIKADVTQPPPDVQNLQMHYVLSS